MNNYESKNLNIIRTGIKKIIPMIENSNVRTIATEVSHAVFEWIDAHSLYYQDQTYNLRDSIGIGVYRQGQLQQWIQHPQAKATEKRSFTYKGEKIYVDGRQLLQEAISLGEESDFADYSFVLYASAPYGILVEEGGGKRGTGWWSEGLVPYVRERFITITSKYNAI